MSSPAWSRPVSSRTGMRQNASISSATKPRYQASRAASIWCSRLPPAATATSSSRLPGPGEHREPVGTNAVPGRRAARSRPSSASAPGSAGPPRRSRPGCAGPAETRLPRSSARGPRTSASDSVPWSRSRVSQPSHAPGTVAASSPVPGTIDSPSPSRSRVTVAAAGTTPCPQSTRGVGSDAVTNTAGTSPPGPHRCGSTTCSTKPAATAASNAFPPRASTAIAVAVPR